MEQLNSTVVTPNVSSSPGPVSWQSTGLAPAVVLSICFLLGVPGNIAVIVLKPNWQHLSSLSQSLMLNLAVSDLLCLLTLPLWIYTLVYSWTFSVASCKLLAYIVYCSIYGSLLTVTLLSVQRYLLVVHVQRCLQNVGSKRLMALLWLVAMILSTPSLVVRQPISDEHWTRCEAHYSSDAQWIAELMTESVVGCVSFCVMAFAYISLNRKVNKSPFFNNPQTTRLVTSITVTYFVLWVPYHTVNVLGVAAISLKDEGLLMFCMASWNIVGAVTFVNSCVNPVLYAFNSHNMCSVCKRRERSTLQNPRTLSMTASTTADARLP
ncbi:leukotriene B4 receptor 1-like [Mugil cephalus]|uniref:leukotriene B4 receptor 1-like n=1 Tax=Mugil cephalus TaxID=48193 RepID=UPI001FB6C3D4|nr:leukotriene B4 receptor 1-like [Mugil cephalus]